MEGLGRTNSIRDKIALLFYTDWSDAALSIAAVVLSIALFVPALLIMLPDKVNTPDSQSVTDGEAGVSAALMDEADLPSAELSQSLEPEAPAQGISGSFEPDYPAAPDGQSAEGASAMLPHMEELYDQNSDLAGWLKIEGTVVDYPVMFTPDDGEFYLYRTFDKQDDPSMQGTLFIDKNCSVEPRGTNLLIHGHNMRNGTMFATLLKYQDESFYRQHPVFEYSTLYETGEYEIVAVFLSKVYNVDDDVFKYYKFYDAETQEEFDGFIDNIKALALYDTGVTAQYGDLLVTLSTCEYTQEDGRLVVVGRRTPK